MPTRIEWTQETWNPTTGCDRVSDGCDNCYALTMSRRLKAMGNLDYQTDGDPRTSGPGFGAAVHPDRLGEPLRWRKPRRVFVNSMSDLFHEAIPDAYIAQVFAVMATAYRHTFQVLTKRHGRMRSLLTSPRFVELFDRAYCAIPDWADRWPDPDYSPGNDHLRVGPLHNVWLGVSVEDQRWADIRVPALLDTPAAVRFLSCEPLLGPVRIQHSLNADASSWRGVGALDWVIVGGESGAGARPMAREFAQMLRDECIAAGVAFFFKQWGSHDEHGKRMSKHAAGRLLDGRTWDEYPTVHAALAPVGRGCSEQGDVT